jgi:hypothetical protein
MDVVGVAVFRVQHQRQFFVQPLQRQPVFGIDAGRAQDADPAMASRLAAEAPQAPFGIHPPRRPRRLCRRAARLADPRAAAVAIDAAGTDVHQLAW